MTWTTKVMDELVEEFNELFTINKAPNWEEEERQRLQRPTSDSDRRFYADSREMVA